MIPHGSFSCIDVGCALMHVFVVLHFGVHYRGPGLAMHLECRLVGGCAGRFRGQLSDFCPCTSREAIPRIRDMDLLARLGSRSLRRAGHSVPPWRSLLDPSSLHEVGSRDSRSPPAVTRADARKRSHLRRCRCRVVSKAHTARVIVLSVVVRKGYGTLR